MRSEIAVLRAFGLSVVLLSFPSGARSAPPVQEIGDECDAFSQADRRDCLSRKVVSTDAAVLAAEGRLLARIEAWDEDAKYRTAAKARFTASKKAFALYRAAECGFRASLGGGAIGKALTIRKLACVVELNVRRRLYLDETVVGPPR